MRTVTGLGLLTLAAGFVGACLVGCAGTEVTPIVPGGVPYVYDQNPVYVPLGNDHYGKVFENVLQVLGDYGFTFAQVNRYGGQIETMPRTAPGLFLFLKPGSPSLYERALATSQSYRHRVNVTILPAEQGGYFIAVTARKDLEDLPRPALSNIGSAIFQINTDLDRDFTVVDANSADAGWISKGRDPDMEQEIIRRLKKLM